MQYEKDMASEHKALFLQMRACLLSFEDMMETKKERITTYSIRKNGICHMRTMPYGVDIGLLKGAKMKDEMNVLTGKGKAMRVIKMKEFNRTIIEHYIQLAIELNKQW